MTASIYPFAAEEQVTTDQLQMYGELAGVQTELGMYSHGKLYAHGAPIQGAYSQHLGEEN
jgi:hypothetical protein